MSQQLPKPFEALSETDVAIGYVHNLWEAIDTCPREFFESNGPHKAYRTLADDLLCHLVTHWRHLTAEQLDDIKSSGMPGQGSDVKWNYVRALLASTELKYEQKTAVVAWCLSQIFYVPAYLR